MPTSGVKNMDTLAINAADRHSRKVIVGVGLAGGSQDKTMRRNFGASGKFS